MPKLVITTGNHKGRSYDIDKAVIIGRGETAGVSIPDTNASREHCRVFEQGGLWVVADLNSVNGIEVNGIKLTRKNLRDGDVIQIGTTCLEFTGGAAQIPSTASGKAAQRVGVTKPGASAAATSSGPRAPDAAQKAKKEAAFEAARQAAAKAPAKKGGAKTATRSQDKPKGEGLEVSDRVLQFNKVAATKNPLSFDLDQYSTTMKLIIGVVALAIVAGIAVGISKLFG